jgi:hypothetical protein
MSNVRRFRTDYKLLLGLRRSVERMVIALPKVAVYGS